MIIFVDPTTTVCAPETRGERYVAICSRPYYLQLSSCIFVSVTDLLHRIYHAIGITRESKEKYCFMPRLIL